MDNLELLMSWLMSLDSVFVWQDFFGSTECHFLNPVFLPLSANENKVRQKILWRQKCSQAWGPISTLHCNGTWGFTDTGSSIRFRYKGQYQHTWAYGDNSPLNHWWVDFSSTFFGLTLLPLSHYKLYMDGVLHWDVNSGNILHLHKPIEQCPGPSKDL